MNTPRKPRASDVLQPETFAIKAGYRANLSPAYFEDDTSDGVVWQPDLYPFAAAMADALDCRQLVDIGCGRGGKLAPLHDRFAVVGLDYGANLASCRAAYPWGTWIDLDLDAPIARADAEWRRRPSGIICADVIEHLVDPRGLLAFIRGLLGTSPVAVVSTPERDLRRGADHAGPPVNPCHVREWTLPELRTFCRAQGLDVPWSGLTRAHTRTVERTTAVVLLAGPGRSAPRQEAIAAVAERAAQSAGLTAQS